MDFELGADFLPIVKKEKEGGEVTPLGHTSAPGVSSTEKPSVAPSEAARLLRLQQAPTRRFRGYRKSPLNRAVKIRPTALAIR
jgi:hypothetical protein